MKNYEEKLLTVLVEKFRSSKKDQGENVIWRRTVVKPEKIYHLYRDNIRGDAEKIMTVNRVAEQLQKRGWITFDKYDFSDEIDNIYLLDGSLPEIEEYLRSEYAYTPKDTKLEWLKDLVCRYFRTTSICSKECEELQQMWEKRKVPANLEELGDVFKALYFLERNTDFLYIREMSMKVFGNSKHLEKKVLKPLCSVLHKYDSEEQDDGVLEDEILEKYHVFKEPQKIRIRGDFLLEIKGMVVDCSVFTGGIEFTSEELKGLNRVILQSDQFMTIENLTSFLRYRPEGKVTFFLGGYANRFQREFLKKVYRDNSSVQYFHFGDIDAGGLWILEHLRRVTQIPFAAWHMGKEDLQNPNYQRCLQALTEEDFSRLQNLGSHSEFSELVRYMLENNVKLEQEIISYGL